MKTPEFEPPTEVWTQRWLIGLEDRSSKTSGPDLVRGRLIQKPSGPKENTHKPKNLQKLKDSTPSKTHTAPNLQSILSPFSHLGMCS